MPSPIAHVAAGYAVYRIFRKALPVLEKAQPAFVLVAAAAVLSLLPDLDAVVGVAAHDFGRFHNNITHSFTFGIVVALLTAMVVTSTKGKGIGMAWFLFVSACYSLHVVMDFFTAGRGVMALWPFLSNRFESPICFFRGVKWATGVWSSQHLWTILNELLFVGVVALVMVLVERCRRTESRDSM
ncbi:MAG: metal-dependent hydrolase [bacterium]